MAAGVTDPVWEMMDVAALIAAQEARVAKRGPYKKETDLIEYLGCVVGHADCTVLPVSDHQSSILPIECPNCGQTGSIAWRATSTTGGIDKSINNLVRVSPGFHWELGRTSPDQLLILCDRCDESTHPVKATGSFGLA